jgi:hypothetical protein
MMQRTPPAEYVSAFQLARILGLPEVWLKREAKEGRLPFLRVGGRKEIMFQTERVRAVLNARAEQAMAASQPVKTRTTAAALLESRAICRRVMARLREGFDALPDDGKGPLVVLGQGEYAREIGGKAKQPANEANAALEAGLGKGAAT